ncbi:MAG: hypothetical protein HOP07_03970 [Bacteriovoracaceae bacterium]|nr:hypothetical protein [Bacteriovoracaceae bacterium]
MSFKNLNHLFSVIYLGLFFTLISCSSNVSKILETPKATLSIVTASDPGLFKNDSLKFPLYLTDKIESKEQVQANYGSNVFIIHRGHLLKASATKEENVAVLKSLEGKGIDAVNLSMEDFIIADQQQISLENYSQFFLNSSVVNLNEDNIVTKPNISSFVIYEGVAFIGLSDQVVDKNLVTEKFLISDYVLAILRAKKTALTNNSLKKVSQPKIQSFVIVHNEGSEINEIIERLPPNFLNSLTD